MKTVVIKAGKNNFNDAIEKAKTIFAKSGDVEVTLNFASGRFNFDKEVNLDVAGIAGKKKLRVLGAGKTTLIKKLFEGSLKREKVALIENEFGEIGVDGAFLKDSGIEIKEINSGIYCFDIEELLNALELIEPNNAQGEYYLTDVVRIMNEEGLKTGAFIVEDNTEILGVNDKIQLELLTKVLASNVGNLTNYITITNTFNSELKVNINKDTINDYINGGYVLSTIPNVNFEYADGIASQLIINSQFVSVEPDYVLVEDISSRVIDGLGNLVSSDFSRWFIIDSELIRGNQYQFDVKRDIWVDHFDLCMNSTYFIERGYVQPYNDLIFNSTNYSFVSVANFRFLIKK